MIAATGREVPIPRQVGECRAARILCRLIGAHAGRPGAFDEGENRMDLVVAQNVGKGRHVRLIAGCGEFIDAVRDQLVKLGVGMLPAMAGLVMRRCRQPAVLAGFPPARLTFQLGTMAGRAILVIERVAGGNSGGILDLLEGRAGQPGADRPGDNQYRHRQAARERPLPPLPAHPAPTPPWRSYICMPGMASPPSGLPSFFTMICVSTAPAFSKVRVSLTVSPATSGWFRPISMRCRPF